MLYEIWAMTLTNDPIMFIVSSTYVYNNVAIQLKTLQQLEIKTCTYSSTHYFQNSMCKKIDAIFYHENMCAMLLARAR